MRLDVEKQIDLGILVCPNSHQTLTLKDDLLFTEDEKYSYSFIDGVPILLDPEIQAAYLSQNDQSMLHTYSQGSETGRPSRWFIRRLWVRTSRTVRERILNSTDDYRSKASREAWGLVSNQPDGSLCLSVGGGPTRCHPDFVNVNIGLFNNVDVVGDAYKLPYRDNSVSAIFCEAVLEHLEFPETAVKEMYRVLAPEGHVFAATPFLQAYHAYPNHFQNFTLTGQQRLFTRNGFELVSSGSCVGPTYVLSEIIQCYVRYYIPYPVRNNIVIAALQYFFAILRRLDRKVAELPNASDVASTTYVHARKPGL
jgi:SAM-dependent methyltransferase